MRSICRCLLFAGLLIYFSYPAQAQQQHPPFWKDIRQFRHEDSIQPPPQHAVLFIGSSSFRKWTDVQQYFPGYTLINRGFGGSTLPDVIRYADDIIFPYHPKQIVIYCGDNDAASPASKGITADSILQRFEHLFTLIRSRLPRARITYVSIKPSPSRARLMPLMSFANWKIKHFLEGQKRASFVDVWHLMLDDHGMPRKDIFTKDMLHMNSKGYAIWQKAIAPYLVK